MVRRWAAVFSTAALVFSLAAIAPADARHQSVDEFYDHVSGIRLLNPETRGPTDDREAIRNILRLASAGYTVEQIVTEVIAGNAALLHSRIETDACAALMTDNGFVKPEGSGQCADPLLEQGLRPTEEPQDEADSEGPKKVWSPNAQPAFETDLTAETTDFRGSAPSVPWGVEFDDGTFTRGEVSSSDLLIDVEDGKIVAGDFSLNLLAHTDTCRGTSHWIARLPSGASTQPGSTWSTTLESTRVDGDPDCAPEEAAVPVVFRVTESGPDRLTVVVDSSSSDVYGIFGEAAWVMNAQS